MVTITRAHRTNMVRASLDMLHAGQEVSSPQKMRDSFEVFGGHREVRAGEDPATTSSVEFYRFMAQCYADIPRSILDHMFSKRDIMANILRTNAKFSMTDFDNNGIPKSVHSKDLTNAAWGRGWAFVMSHPRVMADMALKRLQASEEYRNEQRVIADRTRAEAAAVAAAQKTVDAQKKKEESALAKRTAADAFKQLSQDEQDRIKADIRDKKKQKRDNKEKKLKDAKRKLGQDVSDSESDRE